jgi:hypothetical protein
LHLSKEQNQNPYFRLQLKDHYLMLLEQDSKKEKEKEEQHHQP